MKIPFGAALATFALSLFSFTVSAATVAAVKPASSGFTSSALEGRSTAAADRTARKNELASSSKKDKVTNTTVQTRVREVRYLSTGQIDVVSELRVEGAPRVTDSYRYFGNGDVSSLVHTVQNVFHGVPADVSTTTYYGYDAKGRHVPTRLTVTDAGGVVHPSAVYAYRYVQKDKRAFTITYGASGQTRGYEILNAKGQVTERVENTSFDGTFNPAFETITLYKYDNHRVTEKVYRSRSYHGRMLTARQSLDRKLFPSDVNEYDVVKKVRLLKTAKFYFYGSNGISLTITNYSYRPSSV
jgi:hypothetical protein